MKKILKSYEIIYNGVLGSDVFMNIRKKGAIYHLYWKFATNGYSNRLNILVLIIFESPTPMFFQHVTGFGTPNQNQDRKETHKTSWKMIFQNNYIYI